MAIGASYDLGHNQATTGVTSLAIGTPAGSPVAAGDLIVVAHYAATNAAIITGITDTGGNTYKVARSQGTAPVAEFWYAFNALPMPGSSTIIVNFAGASTIRHGVSAFGCPGIDPAADPFDIFTNSPSGTSTGPDTLTWPAPAQPDELQVIGLFTANAPGVITWSQAFAAIGGNTATAFALPATQVVSDPAPAASTPSWVNSINHRTLGVGFRALVAATGPSDPTPFTGGGSGMRAPRRYIQSSPKPTGPSAAEKQKALTAALRKLTKPKTAPIVVGLESTPEIPFFDDAPPVAGLFTPVIGPQPVALVTDQPLVLPEPEPVKPQKPKPEPDEDDEEVLALMGI